jgi:hypothetical protein
VTDASGTKAKRYFEPLCKFTPIFFAEDQTEKGTSSVAINRMKKGGRQDAVNYLGGPHGGTMWVLGHSKRDNHGNFTFRVIVPDQEHMEATEIIPHLAKQASTDADKKQTTYWISAGVKPEIMDKVRESSIPIWEDRMKQ